MSERFRSYEVARKYFSMIEFVGWATIILSIIGFFVVAANSRGFGAELGMVSAFFILIFGCLSGLVCIGMAQYWRAGVDTAEYTQQMLRISRDHLEISRQGLNRSETPQSFADAVTGKPTEKKQGYAASKTASEAIQPVQPKTKGGKTHMGFVIEKKKDGYLVEGKTFETLSDAEAHIDLVLLPKKKAKHPIKTIK